MDIGKKRRTLQVSLGAFVVPQMSSTAVATGVRNYAREAFAPLPGTVEGVIGESTY
jgi:hypothetical protein